MHWNILDKKRLDILHKFSELKEFGFYLAGGTGLALQIGHRDSIDFDFFTEDKIDKEKITQYVIQNFLQVNKIQDEAGTLTFIVENSIKISFFEYKYKLIESLIATEFFDIASVPDISCMKLNAICNRNTLKDYVDLYFIFEKNTLDELLNWTTQKMPELEHMLILKSLIYFDDIIDEPIIFKTEPVSIDRIKEKITHIVFEYQNKLNTI